METKPIPNLAIGTVICYPAVATWLVHASYDEGKKVGVLCTHSDVDYHYLGKNVSLFVDSIEYDFANKHCVILYSPSIHIGI